MKLFFLLSICPDTIITIFLMIQLIVFTELNSFPFLNFTSEDTLLHFLVVIFFTQNQPTDKTLSRILCYSGNYLTYKSCN